MTINCLEKFFKENKDSQSLRSIQKVNNDLLSRKYASNLPFIAKYLFGNNILKIGKFASFLHSKINQYSEIDKLKSFS